MVELDKEQKQAVEAGDKKVIVVAGAGSGKTRVLTERVRFLLDKKGVNPKSIICITFTNLAANEMRERLVGVPGSGDCFIGTIHSFANQCLKGKQRYKIFNDTLNMEYHKYLIEKYCKHLTFDRWLRFQDAWEKARVGKFDIDQLETFLTNPEKAELNLINRPMEMILQNDSYPRTIDWMCKQNGVITFKELIERATKYFAEEKAYPAHVLVDEFQDVGALEFDFILSLKSENYYMVGDDWQSIYGFNGAKPEIFRALVNNKEWKAYYLNNNYRNAYDIVQLGNRVLISVGEKIDKKINILSKKKGGVSVTKDSEHYYKLKMVLEQVKKQEDFKDWFLLTRGNREQYKIAGLLDEMKIPFIQFKREGMDLAEIRDILKANAIKLLTVHTSKGLETKNVILCGNFPVECPSYMKNEEERRVMYVGVTRAQENLFIFN